jgi:cytochrome bd-type quinol oxidase subunit 2
MNTSVRDTLYHAYYIAGVYNMLNILCFVCSILAIIGIVFIIGNNYGDNTSDDKIKSRDRNFFSKILIGLLLIILLASVLGGIFIPSDTDIRNYANMKYLETTGHIVPEINQYLKR